MAKYKTQKHNKDGIGGHSFARRAVNTTAGKKSFPTYKGLSRKSELIGGSKIITTGTPVTRKAKGKGRAQMPTGTSHNPTGTSLSMKIHQTLAHEHPDFLNGAGTEANMIRTSEAANKGDSFVEAGARAFMARPGKTGQYHLQVQSTINPEGLRTEKTFRLQRSGSVTAYEGRITSKNG